MIRRLARVAAALPYVAVVLVEAFNGEPKPKTIVSWGFEEDPLWG